MPQPVPVLLTSSSINQEDKPSSFDIDIDASITLDLDLEYHDFQSIHTQQSSNLIQITGSFDDDEEESTTSHHQKEDKNPEYSTPSPRSNIISLSSPVKSFNVIKSKSSPTIQIQQPFILPRQLSTPPKKKLGLSPTSTKTKTGSPIPILIRRTNQSPPSSSSSQMPPNNVFPTNPLAETDLEGNAMN
jgi:hypothetical protein